MNEVVSPCWHPSRRPRCATILGSMEDQPAADTDQLPRVGPQDNAAFSNHYKRLQSIEQSVIRAIQAASYVMQELSQPSNLADRRGLHVAATGFLEQIQAAQQQVLEAIKTAAPERNFEANNYFPLVQAMVAAEKIDAVSVHISGISKVLRQHKQQTVPETEGGAADLEGGASEAFDMEGL